MIKEEQNPVGPVLTAAESRRRVLHNMCSSLLYNLSVILFGLLLPRLYLTSFGSELNGLDSTIKQIFSCLTLLEAGVGLASQQAYYLPVAVGDRKAINGIFSATHHYYRRTGIVYLLVTVVFALLYPLCINTVLSYGTVSLIVVFYGIPGIVSYLVLAILCFLCLFFFYVLLINATRNHYQIQRGFSFLPGKSFTTNLKNVLADANIPILSGIKNSLLVAALSAALSIYFSALTAYGVHAYDFKLKKIASAFIILIMTMPTQVSALGFLRLMTNMKLTDTLIPLFLPSIAAPTVYYFMVSYMKSNLPMEIVEAARIDGSGEFHTFNYVVLPIMKPALAVQAIFTFVASWNNYFVPALILTSNKKKTLPILIAQLRSADFLKFDMGQVYMLIAIAIMPVIIIYLFLSKFIVAGVALGGVKG